MENPAVLLRRRKIMKKSLLKKGLMLAMLAVFAFGVTGCPLILQNDRHEHRGDEGDRDGNHHNQNHHDQGHYDNSHGHDNDHH